MPHPTTVLTKRRRVLKNEFPQRIKWMENWKIFLKKRRSSAESKSPKSNKGKCDLAAAFSDSQRSAAGNEIQPKMGTNSAWQMEWLVRSSTHNRYWQGCQNWHRFNDEHAKQKKWLNLVSTQLSAACLLIHIFTWAWHLTTVLQAQCVAVVKWRLDKRHFGQKTRNPALIINYS